ncbi:MAG: hypothetical protein IJU76_15805 [Desulfovibrionaceae bacterium]|nr:hypothetical protein [Desulfovibrionaceae bacterium]
MPTRIHYDNTFAAHLGRTILCKAFFLADIGFVPEQYESIVPQAHCLKKALFFAKRLQGER